MGTTEKNGCSNQPPGLGVEDRRGDVLPVCLDAKAEEPNDEGVTGGNGLAEDEGEERTRRQGQGLKRKKYMQQPTTVALWSRSYDNQRYEQAQPLDGDEDQPHGADLPSHRRWLEEGEAYNKDVPF